MSVRAHKDLNNKVTWSCTLNRKWVRVMSLNYTVLVPCPALWSKSYCCSVDRAPVIEEHLRVLSKLWSLAWTFKIKWSFGFVSMWSKDDQSQWTRCWFLVYRCCVTMCMLVKLISLAANVISNVALVHIIYQQWRSMT